MTNIFTWSQDFMKFRFFMSHGKENSMRDKVIEANLFRDIYIPYTEYGPSQKVRSVLGEIECVAISEGQRPEIWEWLDLGLILESGRSLGEGNGIPSPNILA